MIIDPQSSKPVFEQIANQLRRQILSGIFMPNESLPSLRRLAKEIRVNPNTVQRAYDELSREGLVESRRGAGLFVIAPDSNSPCTKSEERLSKELQQAIANAVEVSVSPQRIRGIFRDALEAQLSKAQKSQ